jgi:hypothetical protein
LVQNRSRQSAAECALKRERYFRAREAAPRLEDMTLEQLERYLIERTLAAQVRQRQRSGARLRAIAQRVVPPARQPRHPVVTRPRHRAPVVARVTESA